MKPNATHTKFMERAIALAQKGRGYTSPNPTVGCVIVRKGRVVGEGYHPKVGGPHAEVVALRDAGAQAKGATAYVTLEPCNHFGRTPPCTDALLKAGIAKVVVGTLDPNPVVSGRGVRRLRAQGVDVSVGVCADACRELIADYLMWRKEGRPLVTVKIAQSLDGRVATAAGKSQWITGEQARKHGHGLRATHDAIMVGVGTVLADDPQLTCRVRGGRDPIRVVVDTHAKMPVNARAIQVCQTSKAPTWIVVGPHADIKKIDAYRKAGADVIVCALDEHHHVDVRACLQALAERDVLSVLLEGGPALITSAVRAQCADRLVIYQAPVLLGGDGTPSINHLNIQEPADGVHWACTHTEFLGVDRVIMFRPA